jgi:hypothetical protein
MGDFDGSIERDCNADGRLKTVFSVPVRLGTAREDGKVAVFGCFFFLFLEEC